MERIEGRVTRDVNPTPSEKRDLAAQIAHVVCDHCARREATVHEAGLHLCAPCDRALMWAEVPR